MCKFSACTNQPHRNAENWSMLHAGLCVRRLLCWVKVLEAVCAAGALGRVEAGCRAAPAGRGGLPRRHLPAATAQQQLRLPAVPAACPADPLNSCVKALRHRMAAEEETGLKHKAPAMRGSVPLKEGGKPAVKGAVLLPAGGASRNFIREAADSIPSAAQLRHCIHYSNAAGTGA